jgi:hypothetical protein
MTVELRLRSYEKKTELVAKAVGAALVVFVLAGVLAMLCLVSLNQAELDVAEGLSFQVLWILAGLAGLYGVERSGLKLAEVLRGERIMRPMPPPSEAVKTVPDGAL